MEEKNTASELEHLKQMLASERYIVLPAKWALALISLIFVWLINRDLLIGRFYEFFDLIFYLVLSFYVSTNIAFTYLFCRRDAASLRGVELNTYLSIVTDALFVSALIYFTGGMRSELYLLFCMLLIRSAASFPTVYVQLAVDIVFATFYVLAIYLTAESFAFFQDRMFIIRAALLSGVALCCWGVANLFRMRWEELGRTLLQLKKAQDQLIQSGRLAVMGQLAAGIAHELKNPLGIITNSIFYLKRHLPGGSDNAELGKHINIVDEETKKSDKIIRDLLDRSLHTRDELVYTDINDLLEKLLSNMEEKGVIEGIKVAKNFAPNLKKLALDVKQIEQAFSNIIMNAKEAMPSGGNLMISTRIVSRGYRPEVDRPLVEGVEKEYVEVSFRDTGGGIPEDYIEKIFHPFASFKEKGSGLGLFVAYNVVQRHGGTISVESTVEKGSTFTVKLPV